MEELTPPSKRHWPQAWLCWLKRQVETWKLKTIYANRTTSYALHSLRLTWLGGPAGGQVQVHWLPGSSRCSSSGSGSRLTIITIGIALSSSASSSYSTTWPLQTDWFVLQFRSEASQFTSYHLPFGILCLLLAAVAHLKLISNTAAVTFDTFRNGFCLFTWLIFIQWLLV